MRKIPIEIYKQYTDALNEKGVTLPCSRCGHTEFFLSNAYFCQNLYISEESLEQQELLPCILICCKKCGNMTTHAPGILLEEEEEEEKLNEL